MAEKNPVQALLNTCGSLLHCAQTHLSSLFVAPGGTRSPVPAITTVVSKNSSGPVESTVPLTEAESFAYSSNPLKGKATVTPLTKEELGRATWTLLHTIAAQYPDEPTRQQKRDVKELMAILSRLYPCKECADHYREILKANPVQAGSQAEFSQWLCHVHNVVNRSLGKMIFPCQRVNARWGKLDCKDRSCDVQGTSEIEAGTTE